MPLNPVNRWWLNSYNRIRSPSLCLPYPSEGLLDNYVDWELMSLSFLLGDISYRKLSCPIDALLIFLWSRIFESQLALPWSLDFRHITCIPFLLQLSSLSLPLIYFPVQIKMKLVLPLINVSLLKLKVEQSPPFWWW